MGLDTRKFQSITDKELFKKHDIEVVDSMRSCDFILAGRLDCEIKHSKKNVIILERYDSVSIGTSYHDYSNPKVRAVFKDYMPKDKTLLLAKTIRKRYHYSILKDIYKTETEYDHERDDKESFMSKFKQVSWCIDQYSHLPINKHMSMCTEAKQIVKDIDVFCISHKHEEHPELALHRADIKTKLADISKVFKYNVKLGEDITSKEFHDYLRRSKICVAPWGIGERIASDQKAILSGCILIKPLTDFVETFPDLYTNKYYIPCNPDMTDLVKVCVNTLERYTEVLPMVQAGQELFKRTTYDMFIERFCSAIKDVYKQTQKNK